ncbi:hypothetical protein [Thalassobellus citreus]|uniref:hypothetical protein n=1 Tax=Thalassobellus citreus TaxID=3367752 RepID=UPI00379B92E5
MIYALNKENKRIRANSLGEIGVCQFCKSSLITTKNINSLFYWHHQSAYTNCDKWYNSICEWHNEWVSNFPIEWQEIIIKKDQRKHIADIKLPNEVVLMLQNSKITSEKIKEKEDFFVNLIWVFNSACLGIFDFSVINQKILNESFYLQINPFGKIKTNNSWDFKRYILNISTPLFIDFSHRLIFIKKVFTDTGNLNLNNNNFNLYKVYSERDKYENIILEIIILTKGDFLKKYYYSQ